MIETSINHGPVSGLAAIPRTPRKIRVGHYYRYSGICSDVRFGAHSNTLQNLQRAVAERVLKVPDGKGGLVDCLKPQSQSYFTSTMRPFREQLRERVRNNSSFPIPPLSSDAFVSLYSGAKKIRYQNACDSLFRESVTPKDAVVGSFVKVEKINFSAKVDPCPRVIQPRSFRYSAALGMQIKHVEKPLFKLINDIFGGPTVLKGYDCVESAKHLRGMWDEFSNPVGVGMDASRFDQHCSKEALKWEHDVWASLCADSKYTRYLLDMQLVNIGKAYLNDGVIRYKTNGCRMSGDMNTSSGNCLLMCAMVYNYCVSHGITHFRLANNGDDCMLVIERKDLDKTRHVQNWFSKLGYNMKVEVPVHEFEEVSFCQTQPCWDGIGWRMVRDPRVAISKDLTSTLHLDNERTKKLWLNAMHHGGKALTAGIPVYSSFYDMFPTTDLKMGVNETTLVDFQQSGFSRMIPKVNKAGEVTPQSRFSFWKAFGILPDTQELLEGRFKAMNLSQCPTTSQQEYSELSLLVENK